MKLTACDRVKYINMFQEWEKEYSKIYKEGLEKHL